MSSPKKLNRRAMLHVSMGAGLGVLGTGFVPVTPPGAECATPLQPEGPFYPARDQLDKDIDLTIVQGRTEPAQGDVIYVSGQVLDDALKPISGALVEIWQANKHGRYQHEDDPNTAPEDPNFQGWGQVRADEQGRYSFKTILPGAYPVDDEWMRPPHIHFKVAKRGYHELITQMYFADQTLNEIDHLLLAIPEEDRDKLVVSLGEGRPEDDPGTQRGAFNIVLQRVARG